MSMFSYKEFHFDFVGKKKIPGIIGIKAIHLQKKDEEAPKAEELYIDNNGVFDADKKFNNLVNAAGFGDRCDFKDMDIDKQLKMTYVDCNAVLYFTKVFLDEMLKQDEGHIINVASIAAFMPAPYMCTYHACKSYVLLLGEAISYEIQKLFTRID